MYDLRLGLSQDVRLRDQVQDAAARDVERPLGVVRAAHPSSTSPCHPGYRSGESRHRGVGGVDGFAVSEAAIEYAFRETSETRQPLVAVDAWVDPAARATGLGLPLVHDPLAVTEQRDVALGESLAGWSGKYPDVTVERRTVRDLPVRALTDISRDARLLVVGCRGRGAVRSLLLGSVSHAASCTAPPAPSPSYIPTPELMPLPP